MSANDIMQAANQSVAQQSRDVESGANMALNYAKAKQDMDIKQQQSQQMQEELDTHKFNRGMGILDTYSKMTPEIRRAMKPQFTKQFGSIGGDPTIFDIVDTDPIDYANKLSVIRDVGSQDPSKRKLALQAFGNAQQFMQGANLAGDVAKQGFAEALAQTKADSLLAATERRAQATEKASANRATLAGASLGIRLDKQEASAVAELANDKEVVPIQQSIQQAKKDMDLIHLARTEGLTPLKAEELVQSYVGLLKGMSNRSTGAEREELQKSALDLETRGRALQQKWSQQNGPVKYEDEPFLQEIESSIQGLHSTLQSNLHTRLKEKSRESSLPSINKVQSAAFKQIMDGAELKKPGAEAEISLPTWADKYKDPKIRQSIQKALDHNYPQDKIEAFIKNKGG